MNRYITFATLYLRQEWREVQRGFRFSARVFYLLASNYLVVRMVLHTDLMINQEIS